MLNVPQIKKVTGSTGLDQFSWKYYQRSGLPVPAQYLENNQVFQMEWQGEMIGGFILGEGPHFRTFDFFARDEMRPVLQSILRPAEEYTEICYYWIDDRFRDKLFLNFTCWMQLAQTVKQYSNSQLLFGTDSKSVAKLCQRPFGTRLIHKDLIYGKETFIFAAESRECIKGFLSIAMMQGRQIFQMSCRQLYRRMVSGLRTLGIKPEGRPL